MCVRLCVYVCALLMGTIIELFWSGAKMSKVLMEFLLDKNFKNPRDGQQLRSPSLQQ